MLTTIAAWRLKNRKLWLNQLQNHLPLQEAKSLFTALADLRPWRVVLALERRVHLWQCVSRSPLT